MVIQRSGWSGQGGFEIYLQDSAQGDKLWDIIWEAGQSFNIRPGCPNLIDRIESDLISYGNDMTIDNNPLECGLDRFFKLGKEAEYMSREALDKIAEQGVTQQKVNLLIEGDSFSVRSTLNVYVGDNVVGIVTGACFSPKRNSVCAFATIKIEHSSPNTPVTVELENGERRSATVYGRTWKNP